MGMPVPESIKNAPQLHLGLELYYDAFFALSSDLTWRAIEDYCDRFDLDDEQREDMHYHLPKLYKVYDDHSRKKEDNG